MESKFSLSLILLLFLVCFSDSRILVFSLSRYEENVAAESDWIADFSWADQYLSPIVFWWSNWFSADIKYSASPEIELHFSIVRLATHKLQFFPIKSYYQKPSPKSVLWKVYSVHFSQISQENTCNGIPFISSIVIYFL